LKNFFNNDIEKEEQGIKDINKNKVLQQNSLLLRNLKKWRNNLE